MNAPTAWPPPPPPPVIWIHHPRTLDRPPGPPGPPGAPGRRARRRPPSWMVTVGVTLLAIAMFALGIGAAGAVLAGFVLLTPIERIWRRHDQPIRRSGLRTDIVHLLLTGLLTGAALLVPIVVFSILLLPVMRFGPADMFRTLPPAVQAVVAFLGIEVLGYWAHRAEHEVSWLWRIHRVHHSSQHLDWISGARSHPLEGLVVGTIIVPPLLFLGVGPTTLGALGAFTQAWAVLLHMNVRWRMRPIRHVWSTPDFHHWHHSNHPEARNRNYSGFLPVLDRIFGTHHLPDDRRPTVYGIDEPMPDGWWRQLRSPFRRQTPVPLP